EIRLLFRSTPRRRIDMEHAGAGARLRFTAGADLCRLDAVAARTVRILHRQLHFVLGVRVEVDDAASEALRHGVWRAEDFLAAHPEQGHAFVPGRLAGLPITHADGGVAIVVAVDLPLESEADQGWRLDDER